MARSRPNLRRGTNLPRVADFNEVVLLDAIRRTGDGLSRIELTRETGLSAQAVSDICRRLLDRGLIYESGKASSGAGKPRTLLQVDPRGGYAVGIHLDPAVVSYVMLDLLGHVVARTAHHTPDPGNPDTVLALMSDTLDRLVTESAVPTDRIAGLGIAAPGPMNPELGIVVDPPLLHGWHNVLLRDHFRRTSGFPVLMDKDVTAAAVAERWAGDAHHAQDFVFVYMGTGIGVGLVVDDIVLRGTSGNAGDIGHLITDVDGPECSCGTRGCLGVAASANMLVERAVDRGILDVPAPRNDPEAIFTGLVALAGAADAGNADAVGLLAATARTLARAIEDLVNLLDTSLVVLGGPLWEPIAAHYLPVIDREVRSRQLFRGIHDVTIRGTKVPDVGAVGAACLVLDQTFSATPTALVFD